jgi:hypothetical protein
MPHQGRQTQVLKCPRCGFDYIRIVQIEVSVATEAPILAKYSCEGCSGGHLTIEFHKGQTFIEEA